MAGLVLLRAAAGIFGFVCLALAMFWNRMTVWPVLGWWAAAFGLFALLNECLATAARNRARPTVRIAGTVRDLLVPVSERDAAMIVTAIEARSDGVLRSEAPVTEERWLLYTGLRRTSALTTAEYRAKFHYRTEYRPLKLLWIVAYLAAVVGMPAYYLGGWVLGHDMGFEPNALVIVLFLAVVVGFGFLLKVPIREYRQFRRGQAYLEAYPEPTDYGPPAERAVKRKKRRR